MESGLREEEQQNIELACEMVTLATLNAGRKEAKKADQHPTGLVRLIYAS